MKSFTLKFALTFLLGVGLASAAVAQKIGGTVKDSAGKYNPVIQMYSFFNSDVQKNVFFGQSKSV